MYSASRAGATQERANEAAFLADALLGICDRLRRLSPSHRDPRDFHEAKSELEEQIRRLSKAAREIGGAA